MGAQRLIQGILFASCLALVPALSALDSGTIPLAPVAAWVEPLAFSPTEDSVPIDTDRGYYYVLNDQQVDMARASRYRHFAFRISSAAGLEDASRIELGYQPAYQHLVLNQIRVWRDGAVLDWRDRVRSKELQREESLADGLYDEARTMLLILEDIREGDVVEYAYTITGANPIFGRHYQDAFDHGLAYPMARLRFRLIEPAGRHVETVQHGTSLSEEASTPKAGGRQIDWSMNNEPAFEAENYLPDWYDPYPWIEISEWRDWQEVKQWGRAVFAVSAAQAPAARYPVAALDELVASLRAGLGDPQDDAALMLALIRFVQDKVRYFGIEIGTNSHKPRHPAEVLGSRFGDCKDKALLVCELARRIGWQAWPVMVNSDGGPGLNYQLPSPLAFDHAIVVLEGPRGRVFIDPTANFQGGDLDSTWVPDYGQVLVLDDGPDGLVKMNPGLPGRTEITETYSSASFGAEGRLVVQSLYTGQAADHLRYQLASQSKAGLEKDYLAFYQKKWAKASTVSSLESSDDRLANRLEIKESYAIPELWGGVKQEGGRPLPAEGKLWQLYVYPYTFSDTFSYLTKVGTDRQMPLSFPWPLDIRHRSVIQLPEDWQINPEQAESDTQWYRLALDARQQDRTVTVDFEIKSKTDVIEPGQASAFLERAAKDETAMMGYTLKRDPFAWRLPTLIPGIDTLMLLIMLAVAGAISFPLMRLLFSPRLVAEVQEGNWRAFGQPEGIGGWLIVILINLALSPLMILVSLTGWETVSSTLCEQVRDTMAWADQIWYFSGAFLEILINVGTVIASFGLLASALQKRRQFPRLAIVFFLARVVVLGLYLAILQHDGIDASDMAETTRGFVSSVIFAAIWIPYLLRSERVKATFCR